MKQVEEALKNLDEKDLIKLVEGFSEIFYGFSKVLHGSALLREMEDKKNIPILDQSFPDVLAKLLSTKKISELIKSDDPKIVLEVFGLILDLLILTNKVTAFKARETPPQVLQEFSSKMEELAMRLNNFKEVLKE